MKPILPLLLLGALLGTGCFSVSTGKPFNEANVARIERGVTTRAEAVALLGKPSVVQKRNGLEVLIWMHTVGRNTGLFTATADSRYVEVHFDTAGIAQQITDSTSTADSRMR